jgi:hypothetical protein
MQSNMMTPLADNVDNCAPEILNREHWAGGCPSPTPPKTPRAAGATCKISGTRAKVAKYAARTTRLENPPGENRSRVQPVFFRWSVLWFRTPASTPQDRPVSAYDPPQ